MKTIKESEAFTRKEFSGYTLDQLFEIMRVAHRVNVRFKYGAIVQDQYAADSVRRALEDLELVFNKEKLARGI